MPGRLWPDRPSERRTPITTTKGFTLIELLVVVAVIAILAAMLLPALQGAKARATLSVCLGHARGLGQAVNAYLVMSEDILPPGKYGHQGGNPVPKNWQDLLWEGNYIDDKKGFQCPSDDVTDNANRYYDYAPAYPGWFSSYAFSQAVNDLFWETHEALAANMANHRMTEDKQILLGDNEANFLSGEWFGWGDADSFKMTYMHQFPIDRHKGRCSYIMLDGHGVGALCPISDAVDTGKFRTEIQAQLQTCDAEFNDGNTPRKHVCFFKRHGFGLWVTEVYWNWQ